ncbi:hypothetical protein MMIC_P0071 [Mariprofundus micogutta]|uniref:Nickel transport protein n=1 Tax=Mariprofundus micogutta TaxID=1921010 RepID=A0A1L8CJP9_9PROT|nr:hypothetical protein [Mariprofundus micogutta]GAV19142.1 hypothetical protein MMIC_P0071 [Mariprofundus micogutta]
MKIKVLAGVMLAVALFSFTAQAAMSWAPAPAKHGHGGHGGRHAAKTFMLHDGVGAELSLINPKLSVMPMQGEHGRVTVKSTGMDNYHALLATRSDGKLYESAVRYVYMFGKPSGESPSLLIKHAKAALEIKPAPLAREHWRYYSNTEAVFVVSYKGKPLANTTVLLKTANGSDAVLQTDVAGKLIVALPEDFSIIKSGRMGNRPSEFLLTANYAEGEQRFTTTFSSAYHINPEHWQSTELGLATVVAGMLLGGLITVRSRRRKEK